MPDRNEQICAPRRVVYLLKKFPRFSETFIVNEIFGLEQLGVDVRLFALKKPDEGRFHAELACLRTRARYLPESLVADAPPYQLASRGFPRSWTTSCCSAICSPGSFSR